MNEFLCPHCGGIAKYLLKNGNYICSPRAAQCPEIRRRNSIGQQIAYKEGRHPLIFTHEHRRKSNIEKIKNAKETSFGVTIIKLTSTGKKYLLESRGHECEECHIKDWQNKKIVFEIDHIDGNNKNNSLNNLKILCPNCHSQTETYRGKNINNNKAKYSKDVIYATYLQCGNINKTLQTLGYATKGANFQTVRKIILDKEFKNLNTPLAQLVEASSLKGDK